VVINQIDIEYIPVLKTKNDPPVGPHGDRPKTSKIASQRMKPKTRQIQIADLIRRVQKAEDIFNPAGMPRVDAPAVIMLKQAFKAFVAKTDNHQSYFSLKM
jgi:hypothetical protein